MQELPGSGSYKEQQLLELATIARKAKRFQVASQAIYQLSRSASLSSSQSSEPSKPYSSLQEQAPKFRPLLECRLAEAKLLWDLKESAQAVRTHEKFSLC